MATSPKTSFYETSFLKRRFDNYYKIFEATFQEFVKNLFLKGGFYMEFFQVQNENLVILGEFYRLDMAQLFQEALKAKGIKSKINTAFAED